MPDLLNTRHQESFLLYMSSSEGETLGHFAKLRPDLKLFATDLAGSPEKNVRNRPIPIKPEVHKPDY